MNQIVTTGIVLARINYGEADRIITVITPDHGKLTLMVRGARKIKSKLAGGVELFSVNSLTFIKGRGDMSTLVSSRLQTHFGNIVTEYARTMIGYDSLKFLNKVTQDNCDGDYYHLILHTLTTLNNQDVDPVLAKCWFMANLLKLLGHTPNLQTDTDGAKLAIGQDYNFDYQEMSFYTQSGGDFSTGHIKALRLLLEHDPEKLHIIDGLQPILINLDDLLVNCVKRFST